MYDDICPWLTMVDQTRMNVNGTSTYLGVRTHVIVKVRAKYARL